MNVKKQKAFYEKPTISVFNVATETPVLTESVNAIMDIDIDEDEGFSEYNFG